jgi:small subunit ribosomal protein S16
MLAIRLQRRGRKGHAQYRVIVQDKDRTPTSGRVVFNLGSYDPHSKKVILNTEKAEYYLSNGAQPSETAARILKNNGVKLPSWVKSNDVAKKSLKNPDKLRKNQPAEEEAPAEEVVAEAEESAEETPATDEPAAEVAEAPAEEAEKAE